MATFDHGVLKGFELRRLLCNRSDSSRLHKRIHPRLILCEISNHERLMLARELVHAFGKIVPGRRDFRPLPQQHAEAEAAAAVDALNASRHGDPNHETALRQDHA